MTYSAEIAKFIINLKYTDIPQSAIGYSKLLMLDTFGVAMAGVDQKVVKDAHTAVKNMPSSAGKIKLWGSEDLYCNVQMACLGNGILSHVLDFDDTHTESILHGSAVLTSLVFNIGEELKKTPQEIITAFVIGWEISARVGIASKNTFHRRGFHTTAIAGVFGAVSAAAKLYELNEQQIINALGLCVGQASGTTEFLTNSSSSKAFHVGWAGFGAITNVILAKSGLTGPETVFEGKTGLFMTHGIIDECEPEEVIKDLGKVWEVENVSIKSYPCCHFGHGFIDCANELRNENIVIDNIEEINCFIDAVPASFICNPLSDKQTPKTSYAGKFSLPFMISAMFFDGKLTLDSFGEYNLNRPEITSLMKKVKYTEIEKGVSGFPKYFPGTFVVKMKDGTVIEKQQKINLGNPDNPLTEQQVIDKFTINSKKFLSEDKIKSCIEFFIDIENKEGIYISNII